MRGFAGSYWHLDDVEFLVDLDETIPTMSVAEKEAAIQAGTHYGEVLSAETPPTAAQRAVYEAACHLSLTRFARDVDALAARMYAGMGASGLTIVSLARAGTPVGVLLTRLLRRRGVRNVRHYSISIVRGRGLDMVALRTILAEQATSSLRFVDGWTGKGGIRDELVRSLSTLDPLVRSMLDMRLWVVSDVSGQADVCATRDDYLLPSAALNATVSGLVSRTVLGPPEQRHRARYLRDLLAHDVSVDFVEAVLARLPALQGNFDVPEPADRATAALRTTRSLARLQARYDIPDLDRVKPGLGETMRAVLRRVPERVVVRDRASSAIGPLAILCEEKNVPLTVDPELPFEAAALVRKVA